MTQLTGTQQRELVSILSPLIRDLHQLDIILNHFELGRVANHKGETLPDIISSMIADFSNQFRVIRLVEAILSHEHGLNGNCPPIRNWLDTVGANVVQSFDVNERLLVHLRTVSSAFSKSMTEYTGDKELADSLEALNRFLLGFQNRIDSAYVQRYARAYDAFWQVIKTEPSPEKANRLRQPLKELIDLIQDWASDLYRRL